jgi:hypothetical protein
MVGMFVVILLLGLGMTVILVVTDNPTVAVRAIGAFTGTLSAGIGLATGYLLGQRNGNGNGKP